jgi:hypothetical protein
VLKLSHDRIIQWGSVASACAAVISAVFVGWQAILFRHAIDDPFHANLQNRQIETCENFMVAHRGWIFSAGWLGFSTTTHWTTGNSAEVTYSSPLTEEALADANAERQTERQLLRANLRDAIIRLGVLSGPTEENVSKALNALNIDFDESVLFQLQWRALRDASPMTPDEHDLVRSEHDPARLLLDRREAFGVGSYDEEAEPLIARCRQLMVGFDPGLF